MNGRWLLAIDTSSEQAGVAVSDRLRLAEVTWPAGREQTVSVLGATDHVLSLLHLSISDVQAVAVAIGPGTFTGLRVGMSLAKGLVLGLGVPLIGVSTLDAAAFPFRGIGRPVLAAVAAGRGRLVWAAYGAGPTGWVRTAEVCNGTAEELAEQADRLGPGALVTGELTPEQEALIQARPGLPLPPRAARIRHPAALAEIAWARFAAGDADDPVDLEPVYVHSAPGRSGAPGSGPAR